MDGRVLYSNRMLGQMEVIFMDSCDSHGRSNWYDVSDMTGFRMIGSMWLQPSVRIAVQ